MIEDLLGFLFSSSGDFQVSADWSLLIFSIASAVIGLMVVTLDYLLVKATDRNSVLKLSYSGYNTIFVFIIWGLGAFIGGYLGAAIGIFEITRVASVFVALSWTTVLPRLVESLNNSNSPERLDV